MKGRGQKGTAARSLWCQNNGSRQAILLHIEPFHWFLDRLCRREPENLPSAWEKCREVCPMDSRRQKGHAPRRCRLPFPSTKPQGLPGRGTATDPSALGSLKRKLRRSSDW